MAIQRNYSVNQVEDGRHFSKELWSPYHVVPDEPGGVRNEKGWGYSEFVRLLEIESFTTNRQYIAGNITVLQDLGYRQWNCTGNMPPRFSLSLHRNVASFSYKCVLISYCAPPVVESFLWPAC